MPEIEAKTTERPRMGQKVIWLQQRTWGGKQNVSATFQCMARFGLSRTSAVIKIDGDGERTVRLSSLRWERKPWVGAKAMSTKPTEPDKLVEETEELLAKATPGRWLWILNLKAKQVHLEAQDGPRQ